MKKFSLLAGAAMFSASSAFAHVNAVPALASSKASAAPDCFTPTSDSVFGNMISTQHKLTGQVAIICQSAVVSDLDLCKQQTLYDQAAFAWHDAAAVVPFKDPGLAFKVDYGNSPDGVTYVIGEQSIQRDGCWAYSFASFPLGNSATLDEEASPTLTGRMTFCPKP